MEITKSSNIRVYENFLLKDEESFVLEYCKSTSYFYGEKDTNESNGVTGLIHQIYPQVNSLQTQQKEIFDIFTSKIDSNLKNEVSDLSIYRMYINCFSPSENPYFHTDGKSGEITFLYYANDYWNIDDGGETQLYVNGTICGVTPIPNRLLQFDANIIHKATSFRDRYRFTIALKYGFPRDNSQTGTTTC